MKVVKIVAAVFAGVVVLLVAAAVIIAWTFDPNDYKGNVAAWVETRTGRELHIEEDLELAFFPWLAVETGGVRLGNAPGFGAEPFATVERAAVRVKLMPLLRHRQIELGTILLDGVELNLARDAEARGNWEDLLGAQETDRTPPVDAQEPGWLDDLQVEGLRIRDATVSWHENTDQLRYVVSGLDVESGPIVLGEPVELELALQAREVESGTTVGLNGRAVAWYLADGPGGARDVALELAYADGAGPRRAQGRLRSGRIEYHPDGRLELGDTALAARLEGLAERPQPVDISVSLSSAAFDRAAQTLRMADLATETGGVRAAWAIEGERMLDAPVVAGTVELGPAPLARLLEVLAVPPPNGVAPQILGDISLSSAFRYELEPQRVSLSNLDARLLGMRVTGEAALADERVRGRIAVPEFTPGDALFALARPHVPDDIDLRAAGPISLSTRFDSDLAGERVMLREVRAGLFGASLTGELDLAPSGNGTLYRGSIASTRFAPDAFAATFARALPQALTPQQLGTLAISTRFSYDTARDGITLDALEAHAFGLSASGRIAGRNVSANAVWTGEAHVARFSPRDLLTRFDAPLPDTSDPSVLTRAQVEARFEVTADRGRFDDIVLALDDMRITGNFTVDGFDDPGYLFALGIDRVDADRYLPPQGDDAEPGEARAGDMELPTESLGTLRLEGRVEVGNLRLAGMDFQQVATNVAWGGGTARLDSARARLYGGAFEGSFAVDAREREPSMTLAGRATGLQLEPIIAALTGDANLSGTGDFDLSLTGRGPTVIDNVRTAAGTAAFTLRDGAIDGFNLGRGLCAAYNLTQRVAAPPAQPDQTRYQLIQGTARVQEGVATSQDLLAVSSFMEVRGTGRLVLVEQRMDYTLEAKLTGSVGIRGCESMDTLVGESIPLRLRGAVTDPEIAPDYSEILERRVRRELERRVTDRLQDLLRQR